MSQTAEKDARRPVDERVVAYPDPAPGESYEHWRRQFNEYVTARLANSVFPPGIGAP